MSYAIFDCEIVGDEKPVFLTCVKIGTKTHSFWMHKPADLAALKKLLDKKALTWVGFNSQNFDQPLIAAAYSGKSIHEIKMLANKIIEEGLRSWQVYRDYKINFLDYDHIDLFDTAPGVKISLKMYAARMSHPSLMDMPFAHDQDLTRSELIELERYCKHDLQVTEGLLKHLEEPLALRKEMSEIYDVDLRSKSDAQIAEAVLKKQLDLSWSEKHVPTFVEYSTPSFIKTDHPGILEIIEVIEKFRFEVNQGNGSVVAPDFLKEPLRINEGYYQMGIGGLHSTHDTNLYLEANDKLLLTDFDVASYYPNIMMQAGLTPKLDGNKGERFIEEYETIYKNRIEAKRTKQTGTANTLKIVLNGTFGKLGSRYSSFYAPHLMLAVTLTGQLNLLSLIHDIEKIKGVKVKSANTDGILVAYPPSAKAKIDKVIAANAKRTKFEYEETHYIKYAAKDVNNYIAVKPDGKVKVKGLYGKGCVSSAANPTGKNQTMNVCGYMAIDYLLTGSFDIKKYADITDFVAVRNVEGGGVQHTHTVEVDDWESVGDRLWAYPGMTVQPKKRKSRPPPRTVGVGGEPFGRIARWYMTKEELPPLSYIKSGNTVPKTEGAKLCLILPKKLPADLNYQWYIDETISILNDLGVQI